MIPARLILRCFEINPFDYGILAFVLITVVILVVTWLFVFLIRKIPGIARIF